MRHFTARGKVQRSFDSPTARLPTDLARSGLHVTCQAREANRIEFPGFDRVSTKPPLRIVRRHRGRPHLLYLNVHHLTISFSSFRLIMH